MKNKKVAYGLPMLSITLLVWLSSTWPLTALADYRTSYTDYNSLFLYEIDTVASNRPFQDILANMEIMQETSLAQLRGGFTMAGLDMNFGATLRTRLDDIHMETVMKLSQIENDIRVRTHSNITSAFDTDNIQVASSLEKNKPSEPKRQVTPIGPSSGRSLDDVAPQSFKLSGLQEIPGVVVQDTKGFMAILHDMTKNSILSAVIGNASARDIHQELDIRLDIRNVEALKAAQLRSNITNSLRF